MARKLAPLVLLLFLGIGVAAFMVGESLAVCSALNVKVAVVVAF